MGEDNVFTYSLILLLILTFTMILGGQQQPLFLSEKVKGEGKPLSSILRLAKPTLQEFPVPLGSGPHDVASGK